MLYKTSVYNMCLYHFIYVTPPRVGTAKRAEIKKKSGDNSRALLPSRRCRFPGGPPGPHNHRRRRKHTNGADAVTKNPWGRARH